MPHLIFLRDGKILLKRPIDQTKLTIGRDPSSDIQLLDPEISRKHCVIEKQSGYFQLTDYSRNGTFVNNRKVLESPLTQQDKIQIGPWLCQLANGELQNSEETFIKKSAKKEENESLGLMLGRSKKMREAFGLIRKAATGDISVCLIGESGTGKELAARSIHDLSERRGKPFVAVNCGAIPANLIESLLFGHEKGSFTGATDRHHGVFEEANTGTLFMDEIGEMPMDLQTRLLRVLENQVVRRVGGTADIKVNVRIVAATNRDLKQQVANGLFRQDLFYRLYIFPIPLAPLRERKEDIAILVKHFLKHLSPSGETISLSEKAMKKLARHEWRGNVRELKNVIQRALLLSSGEEIGADDLNLSEELQPAAPFGELRLGEREKFSIIETLKKFRGNHSHAAKHLGIARTTLASKLRRYKIQPEAWE